MGRWCPEFICHAKFNHIQAFHIFADCLPARKLSFQYHPLGVWSPPGTPHCGYHHLGHPTVMANSMISTLNW
eukprot:5059351-Prorocentrum_lima.AAC.1